MSGDRAQASILSAWGSRDRADVGSLSPEPSGGFEGRCGRAEIFSAPKFAGGEPT